MSSTCGEQSTISTLEKLQYDVLNFLGGVVSFLSIIMKKK